MAYFVDVTFIETSVFTRQVIELLSDDEYAEFQAQLKSNPPSGDVIEVAACARCALRREAKASAAVLA